ncbi:MAG: AAA family ATPase [Ruminococcus sp.]|nr:AAA family ATPase [Ruminococcus sp.]
MNLPFNISQNELSDLLLNISVERPVFIWGAPGIGKSALVQKFADDVGLECVSLLGSQLAPEDIIGIPKIDGETSCFMPPKMIAKKEPYVLFLDELNACSQEVQKAFYSLIHERRIGEYHLPEGSVVIGAGNRSQDGAIVKTMSTALINRMFHVQLVANTNQWLDWAYNEGIHPWITDYITQRPDHLFSEPPKTEEPYSTPRSWHMLSDAIKSYSAGDKPISDNILRVLAYGSVSPNHAGQFLAFVKNIGNKNLLSDIIKGEARFPSEPKDRDVLYFVAQSFRSRLLMELPNDKKMLNQNTQQLAHRAKAMIRDLAHINIEIAQMVVSDDDNKSLPEWFMIEIVRDLPRLIAKNR